MKRKWISVMVMLLAAFSLCAAPAFASGAEPAGESTGESAGEPGGDSAGKQSGVSEGESADESAGAPAGAPGGPGGGGQEFGTFDEILAAAGVIVENGTVSYAEDWDGTVSGDITAQGITNAVITAQEANGIALNLEDEKEIYVVADSDISVSAGQKNNDLGYEAAYGVGIGVNTGELWIQNSRVTSDGPRSTPVYLFSTAQPSATSLVVVDSEITTHTDKADIWMPPFKLLAGGSRATLLMTRNNSWFINSTVTSNNWGAISQDSVEATTYVINSLGMATEGGYGTYLTYQMKLYASQLYGGQYGAFLCGTSLLQTGTAEDAAADTDAMSKTPEYEVEDLPVIIAAPFNAVVVHTSTPGIDRVAVGNFKDALLSTLPEDLPETVTPMQANDAFFLSEDAPFGVGSGSAYFYNHNLYGSLILVRSMNGDFTFDHTDVRTSNHVLVQTVITFDPPSAVGYVSAGQGETLPGVSVKFQNGEYQGDILHQDYQRIMRVAIGKNGTLSGAVVSGTWQGWKDLWSKEQLLAVLEEDGYSEIPFTNENWAEEVQENLIRSEDDEYAQTTNLGVHMTVETGGTWAVTGNSTLASLTLEEGAVVTAPEGKKLLIFENADASNANSSYEGGMPVEELTAGTYDDVILTPVPAE